MTDVTYTYKQHASADEFKKLFKKLQEETIPGYFEKFEAIVAKNGGNFLKGKLTYTDIFFAATAEYMSDMIRIDDASYKGCVTDKYANLKKLTEKVRSLDGIKQWIAKRPENIA